MTEEEIISNCYSDIADVIAENYKMITPDEAMLFIQATIDGLYQVSNEILEMRKK